MTAEPDAELAGLRARFLAYAERHLHPGDGLCGVPIGGEILRCHPKVQLQ